MEPAGLVLGAVVLVKPVVTAVANIVQSERRFGADAEMLHLRFRAQQHRLESFERVLFEPRWQQDQQKVLVWTLFPETVQSDVMGMLHELYQLLNDFTAVKTRYDLQSDSSANNHDADRLISGAGTVADEDRDKLVASGIARAKKKRRSTKPLRRLWWAAYEKKTLVSLVEEFESWNDRLKETIETVWWPLPFLSSITAVENVAKDDDVATTKLMDDVKVRKLLMSGAQPDNDVMTTMKAEKDDFATLSVLSGLEIGTAKLGGGQQPVVVEFKSYGQNEDGDIDQVDLKRIRQLAQLLNQQDDDRFRVLRCVALFDDVINARYGLIFSVPPGLRPQPTNLKEQLANTRTERPALETRVRLAHAVSESLLLLHSVGWIHQSIRCDNIILIPPEDLTTAAMSGSAIVNSFEPRICGFEFSRSMDAYSYRHAGKEPWKNLYRHPDRWGQPSETFRRHHDIYALGVVLLEIGLWERVDLIEGGKLLAEATRYRDMNSSATSDDIKLGVRKRLLLHVNARLGFYMGTQYQAAVRKCLDDTFEDKDPLQSQATLGQAVVRVLESLLSIAGE